ncbi:MAG: hypothetical protein WCI04_00800 [archaeon]
MPANKGFGFGEFNAVVPVVSELVAQSHEWGIRTIFVAGSSAQPFAYLFKQIWMKKFTEPLPKFLALGNSPKTKGHWRERSRTFAKNYPELKNMPSLVFDEFAATGKTIQMVRKEVQHIGFSQVKTAALGTYRFGVLANNSPMPDFVGAKYGDKKRKKAYEYLSIFAGQRADIIEMARERRTPRTMYIHGKVLSEGKAFLKDFRRRSRLVAKKQTSFSNIKIGKVAGRFRNVQQARRAK